MRRILHKYVTSIEGNEKAQLIHPNDNQTEYHKVIQRYKQVVTHDLMCKMEVWLVWYLGPIYAVRHACGST